jgi:hypothetical protein
MRSISFRDLLEQLPRGDSLKAKKFLPGLAYVESENPGFVEPDLLAENEIEHGKTSAVLIAAPGAVGKSTFAAEVARRTGSLLWDLSKFQVGSRTFSGSILDSYGFEATGVLKRFEAGSFLFVLDALDEAQVRAGAQNFDAFLEDLVDTLKGERSRPTLVLLARSDTADWVDLVFQDAGVPLARYQIEFFDDTRAVEFLGKRLDERRLQDGEQPLHRQQPAAYDHARSVLFQMIYDLFKAPTSMAWEDRRVRHFLGYAPVLEALADYLDVRNYISFENELRDEAGAARDPWQFLGDVLHQLLLREKRKVQSALRPNLEPVARRVGWSEWDKLYQPDEQCSRVLAYSLEAGFDGMELPQPLASAYEEGLRTILPQHPYLAGRAFANVIFKEFSYAWGVTRGSGTIVEDLRDKMRQREAPFLPSQLFSRFVASLTQTGDSILDAQDFGGIYESLLARADSVSLSILQIGDYLEASVTLDKEEELDISFNLLDTGAGVQFWRRLGEASIEVDAAVRLGLPEHRFMMGPNVALECRQFQVFCDVLDVDATGGVSIRAENYSAVSPTLKLHLRNESEGVLEVTWPGIGHPWAAYRAVPRGGPASLSGTVRGDTFRKLLLMFRRQRTRRSVTLKSARWSPEQLRERDRLFELAFRRGVLREVSGHEAVEFNSDFDSLQTLIVGKPALSPQAEAFVSEYFGEA